MLLQAFFERGPRIPLLDQKSFFVAGAGLQTTLFLAYLGAFSACIFAMRRREGDPSPTLATETSSS